MDRLVVANEQADRAGEELSAELRNLEFEISKTLNRVEELNREIDGKSHEVKALEGRLEECEREVASLKSQLNSFVSELTHLKGLEQRYKEENGEIQKRIDGEGSQNVELASQIKEVELRVRQADDHLMYMRRELDQSKHNNGVLLESNANLQVEIDSMNNHIRVVSHQNDELTREIDQFVHANEIIRQKLDRRPRVDEIRQRNDQELSKSSHLVQQKSRSPTRGGAR